MPHQTLQLFSSVEHDITSLTCATSSPEQAELIAVGPRHGRGGLGPAGRLRRVLAGAAEAAGGGAGGAGSGPTHGPHAGGGGEADPAAQTLTCGRLGQSVRGKTNSGSVLLFVRFYLPSQYR